MPDDATTHQTIVAVTGDDDRFAAIRSRATAMAAGGHGTVILYDLDAGGLFASPVPTEWSGEGERELTDEEAGPRDRLDADELATAGRGAVADQVRELRTIGIDAWGWLPTSKDAGDLASYAERQGATLVLVPSDFERPRLVDQVTGGAEPAAIRRSPIPFETVE